MERFKEKLDTLSTAILAAKKRVADRPFETPSSKEVDQLASRYLANPIIGHLPFLQSANVLVSADQRRYVKDNKFLVNLLNLQISSLDHQVEINSREAFGLLDSIEQQALQIDSSVSEEEIKLYGKWTTVHFNSLTRPQDLQLGVDDLQWNSDWKTGLPFLPENQSNILKNTGMTLPINQITKIPIVDCVLVSEETDFGDTPGLLVSSSPRHVFLPGLTFKHVIGLNKFDGTSRFYQTRAAQATLMLSFGGAVLINTILVKPGGQTTITIDQLSYINESGEDIALSSVVVPLDTSIMVLFEPVRALSLKINYSQSAPISSGEFIQQDQIVEATNQLLRGVGFTTLLDEPTHSFQGRVYDLSIETIEVYLHIYESLGVFRSLPVSIKNPLGVRLDRLIERLTVETDLRTYSSDFVIPDGVPLQEAYLGVNLVDSTGKVRVNELIPLPDSTPIQVEYLPIVGRFSKVKLFPDIRWTLKRYGILNTTVSGLDTLILHLQEPTDLADGDSIGVVGPTNHFLNGTYTVTVDDPQTIRVTLTDPSQYSVALNQLPKSYIYVEGDQEPPFDVFGGGTLLVPGVDYQFSLDGGRTWLTEYPFSGAYNSLYMKPLAGQFLIQILHPSNNKLYWVSYRPLRDQLLSRTGLMKLNNGVVGFASSEQVSGSLTTVLVNRSDSANPYISPIMIHYALQVRENVSI